MPSNLVNTKGKVIIHFISDKWLSPSTKGSKKHEQFSANYNFQISGPSQKRPSNYSKALTKPNFSKFL